MCGAILYSAHTLETVLSKFHSPEFISRPFSGACLITACVYGTLCTYENSSLKPADNLEYALCPSSPKDPMLGCDQQGKGVLLS